MSSQKTQKLLILIAKISKQSAIASTAGLMLASCGGGDTNTSSTPSVTYSISFSETDVAKYKNADWLFQNYFGEYGLPSELKVMMMPEMMMLANGFALQQSRGENVKEAIAQFNLAMRVMYYSGKTNAMMQKMVVQNEEGLFKPAPESLAPLITVQNNLKAIDEQAQANIAQAEQLEEDFAKEQEQLVENNNLPYALPGQTIKYVIYNQAMKGGGGKNGYIRREPATVPNKWIPINSWSWWNGDFTWVDGAAGIGHMGIIDVNAVNSNPSQKHIIDSNTGPGVKRFEDIAVWMRDGGWSRIEAHYYTPWGSSDDVRRKRVVQYANYLIGRPYNWFFWDKNPYNDNAAYCSQLIWSAYRTEGVDLDSNGGPIVYPRDITRKSGVVMKFQSMN